MTAWRRNETYEVEKDEEALDDGGGSEGAYRDVEARRDVREVVGERETALESERPNHPSRRGEDGHGSGGSGDDREEEEDGDGASLGFRCVVEDAEEGEAAEERVSDEKEGKQGENAHICRQRLNVTDGE